MTPKQTLDLVRQLSEGKLKQDPNPRPMPVRRRVAITITEASMPPIVPAPCAVPEIVAPKRKPKPRKGERPGLVGLVGKEYHLRYMRLWRAERRAAREQRKHQQEAK
jgi:hypothetical protein